MSKTKSKVQKLRSLKRKKIALIIVEVLVALCVIAAAIITFVPSVRYKAIQVMANSSAGRYVIKMIGQESFEKSVFDIEFDDSQIQTNEITYNYSEEYTHFVLFGIDSRTAQFDEGTNSDSIVIVSIHNTTGEVKMVSLYRDTFLRIYNEDGSHYYSKINAAYSVAGATGAINTINRNLDLQIKDYVTVNFSGVAEIVDALGGIEVNLTEDEKFQLNKHLKSSISTTGIYDPGISSSGENIHLNGIQAVTYCRIRKATYYDPDTGAAIRDDFGRAARQRSVIMKLVDKAKGASIEELTNMMEAVLNKNSEGEQIIKTSFTLDEMIDMLPIIFKFSLSGSQGFPRKLTTGYVENISYVMPKGVERNVKILHKFLYGEADYIPTSTVSEISSDVAYLCGVGDDGGDDTVDDTVYFVEGEVNNEEETTTVTIDFDYDDGGNSDFY